MEPQDLELPSATPSRQVDSSELAGRAQTAVGALAGARTALQLAKGSEDTAAIRRALFRADWLGIAGAAPATVRDSPGNDEAAQKARDLERKALHAQVDAASSELDRRQRAITAVPVPDAGQQILDVFGETFTVLPAFEAPLDDGPFDTAAAPSGATAAGARTLLSRTAPVRASSGSLNAVLGYADAVAAVDTDAAPPALQIGQLGGAIGERWVGLPPAPGEAVPGGRVSLVAVTVGDVPPEEAIAGLFVDEWVEVVPSAEETTSVAFHYDAPTACAPQVMLLGVPPAGHEHWRPEEALRIIEEAHALARLRLVDLEDVPDLGQLLPALVSDENPAGDAIGLDVEFLTEEAP